MVIQFNDIPTTMRTPGAYNEIDNSRALQGLVQNPHVALIIGQKIDAGSAALLELKSVTTNNVPNSFFGPGSQLARMCNKFKLNNPNTELHAIAVSDNTGGVAASGAIQFSVGLSANGFSAAGGGIYYLMLNGTAVDIAMTSGWSVADINSEAVDTINGITFSELPMTASTNAASALTLIAANTGTPGNYLDIRANYYDNQSLPSAFTGDSVPITGMAGGTGDPDIGSVWAIIDNEQYHYMIQPYIDSANLTEIEDELSDRFGPLVDLQGHGFAGLRGTHASCTTLGNTRNSPHNTIMGAYDCPNDPAEFGAVLGAQAAFNLNNDPARPLHTLEMKGILPPPLENQFSRSERDILLYDGIATFTVQTGKVLIERCITTYQTNALGLPDPSYLDIQTMATLNEIRFQYKTRMTNRFIVPRFKLADDTFPVQPGSKVATPRVVKGETIALFTLLRDQGLVENLDDFITNLVVQRNATDPNRVDALLPPDLVNQFRILAGLIQFIL